MVTVNPNMTYHPRSRKSIELTRRKGRKENILAKERQHKKKNESEKVFFLFLQNKLKEDEKLKCLTDDVYAQWIYEFATNKMKEIIGERKINQLKTNEQLVYIYYKNILENIQSNGMKILDLTIKLNVDRVRNWDGKKIEVFNDCPKKLFKIKSDSNANANINLDSKINTSSNNNEMDLN